uniref:Uncharacterized protein n=1 Tax=Megaselia scalaris TaxID=36166 RepID=T1GPT6_MEGSC
SKRSVRFVSDDGKNPNRDGDGQAEDDTENQINELIPIKKHSTLFNNVLRPNSAMRQLFPAAPCSQGATLTSEALRAFDESKKTGTNMVPALMAHTDTIQRNILRRSLIKKKTAKCETSLEERIKQLTMDIEESSEEQNSEMTDELNHRDSPAGEENPQKSFSPSSSISSSSSGSSSAYKKISDIFSRDKKQDKIPEMEENPIVIIPQLDKANPTIPDYDIKLILDDINSKVCREDIWKGTLDIKSNCPLTM